MLKRRKSAAAHGTIRPASNNHPTRHVRPSYRRSSPWIRCSRPNRARPPSTPALSSSKGPRLGRRCTPRCCPPRSFDTSTHQSLRCPSPLEMPSCCYAMIWGLFGPAPRTYYLSVAQKVRLFSACMRADSKNHHAKRNLASDWLVS